MAPSSEYRKSLDKKLARLSRVVSSPAGLDAVLASVCYTSLLLNFQTTTKSTQPSRLKALYEVIEDHRIFTRLFGLLGLYTTANDTYTKQHRDPAIKLLLWASLVTGSVFQVLENVAFLVQKGILNSQVLRRREGVFWKLSNRFWLAQLSLSLMRLVRVRQMRFREDFGAEKVAGESNAVVTNEAEAPASLTQASSEVDMQSAQLEKNWWRELYTTLAWVPCAIHWSFDEHRSPVSQTLFAGSGMVSGLLGLKDAWEDAA